jgi:hypothetical protein
MVCARKAAERRARARSEVQDRGRSQELDRQKVESLGQKTGLCRWLVGSGLAPRIGCKVEEAYAPLFRA